MRKCHMIVGVVHQLCPLVSISAAQVIIGFLGFIRYDGMLVSPFMIKQR